MSTELYQDPVTSPIVYLTPSEYAEGWFHINSSTPYSLDRMPYMRPIYNCGARCVVLKCGRQVGKSMFLLCTDLTYAASTPGFGILYGVPDETKLRTYSNQKMHTMLMASKEWTDIYLKGPDTLNNVLEKRLTNGSTIFLRNAANVGNFRAPSADKLDLDEVQDMQMDVLEVAEHTLFASPYKLMMFSGTPKSFQAPIEGYWRDSSQNEWLMPCQACVQTIKTGDIMIPSHFWNCTSTRNLSPTGLICEKCGQPLNPVNGKWVSMNPGQETEGFRIPQPISPFADFAHIWNQYQTRPTSTFQNEVMGLSWDNAARYFTIKELQEACSEYRILNRAEDADDHMRRLIHSRPLVAGIDWGLHTERGGYTVLVIWMLITPTDARMIYGIKVPKNMAWDDATDLIIKRLGEFGVNLVCADWGAAGNRNIEIAQAIGLQKVVQINYDNVKMNIEKEYGAVRLIDINRTLALSNFKTDVVARREIHFPIWEDFEPFGQDILNEGVVDDGKTDTLRYDHPKGTNDDALMANVYANIARRLFAHMPVVEVMTNAPQEPSPPSRHPPRKK